MIEGKVIPDITFMYREGDEAPDDGGCPIGGEFVPTTTEDLFAGKRVIVFSLPGAYTPTCSTYQLPGFEENYDEICEKYKVDEIYVSSVNDGFVMNAWADYLDIKNVKVIPDGNGEFADSLGMFIDMSAVGFGKRSRRFAVVLEDGVVVKAFVEPVGTADDPDPYGETSPENVIAYFESVLEPA
ncbi:MAG: redoxin family protein [Euryarchaeota archaeon]|jgi:peroxiredoxin